MGTLQRVPGGFSFVAELKSGKEKGWSDGLAELVDVSSGGEDSPSSLGKKAERER